MTTLRSIIQWAGRFVACSPFHPARVRQPRHPTERTSGSPAATRRLSQLHYCRRNQRLKNFAYPIALIRAAQSRKISSPQTRSDMSRRHEQKHLLHNWSDCRYRDRPQTPRAVLRVSVASGSQRLISTGEQSGLQMRIVATESGSLCVRMKS